MFSRYKAFIKHVVYKYFLPDCSFSFHSLHKAFCRTKVLNFHEVQFFSFFLYGSIFHLALGSDYSLQCFFLKFYSFTFKSVIHLS